MRSSSSKCTQLYVCSKYIFYISLSSFVFFEINSHDFLPSQEKNINKSEWAFPYGASCTFLRHLSHKTVYLYFILNWTRMEKQPTCKIEGDRKVTVKVEQTEIGIIRHSKKKFKQKSSGKNSKNCHWNLSEQTRYLQFIQKKHHLFKLTHQERRVLKVHKMMGSYIRTRNCLQCRSFHQKKLMKYGTIEGILQAFGREIIIDEKQKQATEKQAEEETILVKKEVKEEEEKEGPFQKIKVQENPSIVQIKPVIKHAIKVFKNEQFLDVKEEEVSHLQDGYINFAQTQ